MNSLDKMNVGRLMLLIKTDLENAFSNLSINDDDAAAKNLEDAVKGYLSKMPIENYKTASKVVFRDWKTLYPNIWTRMLARTAKLFRMPLVEHEQRWYHTVMPYDIEMIYSEGCEPDVLYSAMLLTPYRAVECDLTIQPRMAINELKFNIKITKGVVDENQHRLGKDEYALR